MQEQSGFDSFAKKPTYVNGQISELYQNGVLSRVEAEAMDIVHTCFSQGQENETRVAEPEYTRAQWETSCVAIIHDGEVVPVLNLEDVFLRPRTPQEKLSICKRAACIMYDVLLTLLEEEEA
ncbi:hypothetical protein [Dictyobacter formicarum]|uniref:Uncharacterized protein n=1 Tax=Dictyobacter formicarum TaxID=2778368 RepID=A0ABQ3VVE1_9CHLR|nr:hypothetical protein [Dictyobacter formicarum]GHO89528.1 hypothetical protein KSZ_75340 [Dictyobacter formicarum]